MGIYLAIWNFKEIILWRSLLHFKRLNIWGDKFNWAHQPYDIIMSPVSLVSNSWTMLSIIKAIFSYNLRNSIFDHPIFKCFFFGSLSLIAAHVFEKRMIKLKWRIFWFIIMQQIFRLRNLHGNLQLFTDIQRESNSEHTVWLVITLELSVPRIKNIVIHIIFEISILADWWGVLLIFRQLIYLTIYFNTIY